MNTLLKITLYSLPFLTLVLVGCQEKAKTHSFSAIVVPSSGLLIQPDIFSCTIVIPNLNMSEINNVKLESEKEGVLTMENGIFYWEMKYSENKGTHNFKGNIEFDYHGERIKSPFNKPYYIEAPIAIVNAPLFGNLLINGVKNPIDFAVSGILLKDVELSVENANLTFIEENGSKSYFLTPINGEKVTVEISINHDGEITPCAKYFFEVISEKTNMNQLFESRMNTLVKNR